MKKQEPGVELCHRRMGCNLGKKIDYNSRGTGSADYESRGDSIPGAGREGIRLAQGDATSDHNVVLDRLKRVDIEIVLDFRERGLGPVVVVHPHLQFDHGQPRGKIVGELHKTCGDVFARSMPLTFGKACCGTPVRLRRPRHQRQNPLRL